MPMPSEPKIYHIVHVDRLPSIISNGGLCCDADTINRSLPGTAIGMSEIKTRRLYDLTLANYPTLHIGDCVPFYFCPRSIMLYIIYHANHPKLSYRGGQSPIIHLEADLRETVAWAESQDLHWAFTLSNAGAYYCEHRFDLVQLKEINWDAVEARDWQKCQEDKQAEFLIEKMFPWDLVRRIGVSSRRIQTQVTDALEVVEYRPLVVIKPEWYY